jgi:hypothetical protein
MKRFADIGLFTSPSKPNRGASLSTMDFPFPIAGPIVALIVLVGSIAFLKLFDYLAAQSVKRLLEMAGDSKNS